MKITFNKKIVLWALFALLSVGYVYAFSFSTSWLYPYYFGGEKYGVAVFQMLFLFFTILAFYQISQLVYKNRAYGVAVVLITLLAMKRNYGDGDTRYELAKLFHSVDGKYDFIIKDLFEVSYDLENASLTHSIQDRKRDFDLYKVFLEIFKNEIGDDIKKIELIEALLFLSMIPLHGESLRHQMVMLGTGLDILNRVEDIKA